MPYLALSENEFETVNVTLDSEIVRPPFHKPHVNLTNKVQQHIFPPGIWISCSFHHIFNLLIHLILVCKRTIENFEIHNSLFWRILPVKYLAHFSVRVTWLELDKHSRLDFVFSHDLCVVLIQRRYDLGLFNPDPFQHGWLKLNSWNHITS